MLKSIPQFRLGESSNCGKREDKKWLTVYFSNAVKNIAVDRALCAIEARSVGRACNESNRIESKKRKVEKPSGKAANCFCDRKELRAQKIVES